MLVFFVLAGALRAALSSCRALWAFGVQIWSATCTGGLSSQGSKRRLIRAAHRESILPCRRSVSSGTAEGLSFRRRQPPSSFAGCWSTFALLLLKGVRWAFWTPAVVAGVFVGRLWLHGSYTTASTAAALWFQPVVSGTASQSRQVAIKKPAALLVGWKDAG